MHILVLLKMVPDVVEDLEIASDGRALDLDYLRMILSESDDHALEQALLLKERHGGKADGARAGRARRWTMRCSPPRLKGRTAS